MKVVSGGAIVNGLYEFAAVNTVAKRLAPVACIIPPTLMPAFQSS